MTYIPGGGSGGGTIATSGDVALSNPVNGEVLTYDAAVAKWKNASVASISPALIPLQLKRATSTDAWSDGNGVTYSNTAIASLRPHPIHWLATSGAEPTWGTNDHDANNSYGDIVVAWTTSSNAPMTWQQAWDSGSLTTLRQWFVDNTGPTVTLDEANPLSGIVSVASQTEADALVGKVIKGRIDIASGAAGPITIKQCRIDWVPGTGGSPVNVQQDIAVTFEDIEVDAKNDKDLTTAFGGLSYYTCTMRRVDIHGFNDAVRLTDNGTYENIFIHDPFRWDTAVHGAYDGSIHPHADGAQAVRGPNITISKSFIDMGIHAPNHVSAVLYKTDAATIDNITTEYTYLNGGGYTCHIHEGAHGDPTNIKFLYNRFGRNYKNGLWSHQDVLSTNITKTGNVWADDLTVAPTTEGPL